ncbi:hypothetical protein AVEN_102331-1 [Araneus ventricosus]|uniref:Uncharacterized protein n=1 Tax=Araneus ventricosus TaxID=182803 RepID=A0A4Y2VD06_ARAVE|nr:hypothetical protein AVEN_102331-1 [Araneus ventricosus]
MIFPPCECLMVLALKCCYQFDYEFSLEPLDVPDQQTSFLIEELGVPPLPLQQDSQPVNSHPFPCFRIETRTTKIQQHKSSSIQLVIPGISPFGGHGPQKVLCRPVFTNPLENT